MSIKRILAYAGIVISVIAIIVSIRSCQISQEALDIQSQQAYAVNLTNYVGVYSDDNKTLSIKTTNPNVTLQSMKVYYPSEVSDMAWDVEQPSFLLHLTSPIFKIKRKVEQEIEQQEGIVKILDGGRIPIIIESNYLSNGSGFFEKSLYSLDFEGIIWEESGRSPDIKIKGITFINRLPLTTMPTEYLDALTGASTQQALPD